MLNLAREAVEHINEKQYTLGMLIAGVKEIHCFGIDFREKEFVLRVTIIN